MAEPSSAFITQIALRLIAKTKAYSAMATLVSPSLAITTNHALLEGQTEYNLQLVHPGGQITVEGSIVARQIDIDFAVLELVPPISTSLPTSFLADSEPEVGAKWECYYIDPFSLKGVTIKGTVGDLRSSDDRRYIRLISRTPRSVQGISGAPIIVEEQLVGVMAGTNDNGTELYAIPLAEMVKSPTWNVVRQTMGGPTSSKEFDKTAFWERLSEASKLALQQANGIRMALPSPGRVHMEHVVAGLFKDRRGPTRITLSKAGVDEEKLKQTIYQVTNKSIPLELADETIPLLALPAVSGHVEQAFVAANDIADKSGSEDVLAGHLLYGVLSADCKLSKALLDFGIDKNTIPLVDTVDETPKPRGARRHANAGISSDDPEGKDLLDIEQEVEALCTVLAAKDVAPPISIGLFGDWGSGKSFFMRKMEKRFDEIKTVARKRKGDTDYCENIVQLWFNAWTYMDTNLWASIAAEIFDGLAEALAKEEALKNKNPDRDYQRAQLIAQNASANDKLAKARQARQGVEEKLRASQQRLASIQSGEADLAASPRAALQEAYRFAVQQPQVRETIKDAEAKLDEGIKSAAKKLNISADRDSVQKQLLELQGLWGYVRAIFLALSNRTNRRRWLLYLAIIVSVAIVTVWLFPAILTQNWIQSTFGRLASILVAILAAVAPFIPGARSALKIIDGAIKSNQNALEKSLQEQHETLQKQAAAAQKDVEAAAANAERSKKQLENLQPDRQILDFIKRRQQSTDYTRHLGVIAKARNDFEELSALLVKERELPPKTNEKEDRALPETTEPSENGAPQETTKLLLPRIDRIILYIDDLDRCPENKVVDVLQAVHLLLAFPLFIVVVGVDPRWLLHSLRQHSEVFRRSDGKGFTVEERTHWQSTPLNYLEKIFQVPFTLWPMDKPGFANMIDDLTAPKLKRADEVSKTTTPEKPTSDKPETESVGTAGSVPADAPGNVSQVSDASGSLGADKDDDVNGTKANPPTETQKQDPSPVKVETSEHPPKFIEPHPAHLQIKEWESEFMKKLHCLIPSPRATKRFVNIYRLIRASVDIDDEVKLNEFVGDKTQGEYRAVLLLLAILTGYPDQATEILRELIEKKNHKEKWWELIDSIKQRREGSQHALSESTDPLKKSSKKVAAGPSGARAEVMRSSTPAIDDNGASNMSLDSGSFVSDAEAQRWEELFENLNTLRKVIPNESCEAFETWAPKVARYSFQSGRVLLMKSVTGSNN
jgi:hypothetical protein